MARFRQPGVAFGSARIASIKADNRREQERIRQSRAADETVRRFDEQVHGLNRVRLWLKAIPASVDALCILPRVARQSPFFTAVGRY